MSESDTSTKQTSHKWCVAPNCVCGTKNKPKCNFFQITNKRIDAWKSKIPRKDRVLKPGNTICACHFAEEFIIREVIVRDPQGGVYMRFPSKTLRLTADAVPTIYPNCPEYMSSYPRKRRPLKRNVQCTNTPPKKSNAKEDVNYDENTTGSESILTASEAGSSSISDPTETVIPDGSRQSAMSSSTSKEVDAGEEDSSSSATTPIIQGFSLATEESSRTTSAVVSPVAASETNNQDDSQEAEVDAGQPVELLNPHDIGKYSVDGSGSNDGADGKSSAGTIDDDCGAVKVSVLDALLDAPISDNSNSAAPMDVDSPQCNGKTNADDHDDVGGGKGIKKDVEEETTSETDAAVKTEINGNEDSAARQAEETENVEPDNRKSKDESGEKSKKKKKTCEQCGEKKKKLRYQVFYKGKALHLCSPECFTAFKANQQQSTSSTPPTTAKADADKLSESEAEKPDISITVAGWKCVKCCSLLEQNDELMKPIGDPSILKGFFASTDDSFLCSPSCLQQYDRRKAQKDNVFECAHCRQLVDPFTLSGDKDKVILWETMQFCSEQCLHRYQTITGNKCAKCAEKVPDASLGKYCVRFGADIRQFCSSKCLDDFKKGLKVCSFCQKDLASVNMSNRHAVADKGIVRVFCSHTCLTSYEKVNSGQNDAREHMGVCSVCNAPKTIPMKVEYKGVEYPLCGGLCLSRFRFLRGIRQPLCDHCFKFGLGPSLYISHGMKNKRRFCSQSCLNLYVLSNRRIIPCSWCRVKKYNFDMIETQKSGEKITHIFCSLNCMKKSRSKEQATAAGNVTIAGGGGIAGGNIVALPAGATAAATVPAAMGGGVVPPNAVVNAVNITRPATRCDRCGKLACVQFHLTMSDASVRNFCSYPCALAFQSQFKNVPLLTTRTPTSQLAQQAAVLGTAGGAAIGVTQTTPSLAPPTASTQPVTALRNISPATIIRQAVPPRATTVSATPVISNIVSLAPSTTIRQTNAQNALQLARTLTIPFGTTISRTTVSGTSVGGGGGTTVPVSGMLPVTGATTNGPSLLVTGSGGTPAPGGAIAQSLAAAAVAAAANANAAAVAVGNGNTTGIVTAPPVCGVSATPQTLSAGAAPSLPSRVVFVQPPPPQVRNKACQVTPVLDDVLNRRFSRRLDRTRLLKMITAENNDPDTIKDEDDVPILDKLRDVKGILPIPVPVFVPVPVHMYVRPVPQPVPVPIPVPIPIFLPTTCHTADDILQHLREMREKSSETSKDYNGSELVQVAKLIHQEYMRSHNLVQKKRGRPPKTPQMTKASIARLRSLRSTRGKARKTRLGGRGGEGEEDEGNEEEEGGEEELEEEEEGWSDEDEEGGGTEFNPNTMEDENNQVRERAADADNNKEEEEAAASTKEEEEGKKEGKTETEEERHKDVPLKVVEEDSREVEGDNVNVEEEEEGNQSQNGVTSTAPSDRARRSRGGGQRVVVVGGGEEDGEEGVDDEGDGGEEEGNGEPAAKKLRKSARGAPPSTSVSSSPGKRRGRKRRARRRATKVTYQEDEDFEIDEEEQEDGESSAVATGEEENPAREQEEDQVS